MKNYLPIYLVTLLTVLGLSISTVVIADDDSLTIFQYLNLPLFQPDGQPTSMQEVAAAWRKKAADNHGLLTIQNYTHRWTRRESNRIPLTPEEQKQKAQEFEDIQTFNDLHTAYKDNPERVRLIEEERLENIEKRRLQELAEKEAQKRQAEARKRQAEEEERKAEKERREREQRFQRNLNQYIDENNAIAIVILGNQATQSFGHASKSCQATPVNDVSSGLEFPYQTEGPAKIRPEGGAITEDEPYGNLKAMVHSFSFRDSEKTYVVKIFDNEFNYYEAFGGKKSGSSKAAFPAVCRGKSAMPTEDQMKLLLQTGHTELFKKDFWISVSKNERTATYFNSSTGFKKETYGNIFSKIPRKENLPPARVICIESYGS